MSNGRIFNYRGISKLRCSMEDCDNNLELLGNPSIHQAEAQARHKGWKRKTPVSLWVCPLHQP